MSEIELGAGATLPLGTWVRIGIALDRPLAASLSREIAPEPRDAGHLAAQELLLRVARATGRTGSFEVPTRPSDPSRATDVGLRDDAHRVLIRVEIWNRLDDLGRAMRDSDRKDAEAATHAQFANPPYRVATCWLLVDTAANRALVKRYPEILGTRFTGRSSAWARALDDRREPPMLPGLCWIDPHAGQISALRLGRAGDGCAMRRAASSGAL
jgi:hypothetical protein